MYRRTKQEDYKIELRPIEIDKADAFLAITILRRMYLADGSYESLNEEDFRGLHAKQFDHFEKCMLAFANCVDEESPRIYQVNLGFFVQVVYDFLMYGNCFTDLTTNDLSIADLKLFADLATRFEQKISEAGYRRSLASLNVDAERWFPHAPDYRPEEAHDV